MIKRFFKYFINKNNSNKEFYSVCEKLMNRFFKAKSIKGVSNKFLIRNT